LKLYNIRVDRITDGIFYSFYLFMRLWETVHEYLNTLVHVYLNTLVHVYLNT